MSGVDGPRCIIEIRSMKSLCFALLAVPVALVSTGCGPRVQKVSERDLNEARALYSEAQYAMTMKDWPRAEPLLIRVIKITPTAEFFQNLGTVRMRQKNRAGAKEAYESAVAACERMAAAKKDNTDPLLKKIQLFALLGRIEDARKLQAEVEKEFPQDRAVRAFVDGKALDAMIAAPFFKELAL